MTVSSRDIGKARVVFIDTEYTGEHAGTTLVSMGLVTLDGQELYLVYNDYERDQVTDWLRENVLGHLDTTVARPARENLALLHKFLEGYVGDGKLFLVSAGLTFDIVLFLDQFKHAGTKAKYFHALHDPPRYVQNASYLDLNTLMRSAGFPSVADRAGFAGVTGLRRHDALDDARVVRGCFLRLLDMPVGETLASSLRLAS
jgi:DNA polymerase III epsilon subunit-like protein